MRKCVLTCFYSGHGEMRFHWLEPCFGVNLFVCCLAEGVISGDYTCICIFLKTNRLSQSMPDPKRYRKCLQLHLQVDTWWLWRSWKWRKGLPGAGEIFGGNGNVCLDWGGRSASMYPVKIHHIVPLSRRCLLYWPCTSVNLILKYIWKLRRQAMESDTFFLQRASS